MHRTLVSPHGFTRRLTIRRHSSLGPATGERQPGGPRSASVVRDGHRSALPQHSVGCDTSALRGSEEAKELEPRQLLFSGTTLDPAVLVPFAGLILLRTVGETFHLCPVTVITVTVLLL
jgi:hypothetical protein